KDYDFNFDVNTTDKIVCSELIYVSYPSIAWPTEHVVGRFTISPDNVARLAAGGAPLRLVRFYHDGELVAGAAAEERFNYFVQPAMMEAGQ
ncbi:MAG TPA: Poxvirus G6, partial [Oligoflexia bacterium]|nr:Poxvirus G6 [Oligoflexia bacterium]